MEALAGGSVQELVERVVVEPAALALLQFGEDLGLGRGKHAVEPAEHGHGQHDPLVLRRAVRPAEQVGDLPDQVGEVVMVGHRSRSSGPLLRPSHQEKVGFCF